ADKALELDPRSTAANVAIAIVHRFHWRWAKAIASFATAFEQSPLDVDAANGYGMLLSWSGRHDAAIPLIERATQLNPNSPPTPLAIALANAGRADAAAAVLRRAAERAPANAQ